MPKLKGIHYAMRSGMLAAEAIYEQLQGRRRPGRAGRAGRLRPRGCASSHIWSDLRKVRNMRQALGKGFVVGGAAGRRDGHHPRRASAGGSGVPPRRRRRRSSDPGKRVYPAPDGKLTFDKLSSVFLSGNRSRDDQPNHIRVQEHVPREVAEAWVAMCPAAVYEIGRDDGGPTVQLKLAPSNCVQCGAITAKGGRLTPPEGGSGPEYTRDVGRGQAGRYASSQPTTWNQSGSGSGFSATRHAQPAHHRHRGMVVAGGGRDDPGQLHLGEAEGDHGRRRLGGIPVAAVRRRQPPRRGPPRGGSGRRGSSPPNPGSWPNGPMAGTTPTMPDHLARLRAARSRARRRAAAAAASSWW